MRNEAEMNHKIIHMGDGFALNWMMTHQVAFDIIVTGYLKVDFYKE
jgi:hypothetical protein